MIYDNFDDYNRNFRNDNCMMCHECGRIYDTCVVLWEDGNNDKSICIGCTEKHYKKGDPGIYPIETGMGVVSSLMLLFEDWAVFFGHKEHKRQHWRIERQNGRLWLIELYKDGKYAIRRYRLIATDSMIRDFYKFKQEEW